MAFSLVEPRGYVNPVEVAADILSGHMKQATRPMLPEAARRVDEVTRSHVDKLRDYCCAQCGRREGAWWNVWVVGLPPVWIPWPWENSCYGCGQKTVYERKDHYKYRLERERVVFFMEGVLPGQ